MVLLLFCTQLVIAQDFSRYQKKTFESTEGSISYRILYPDNYKPTKKYPLVVFLHGAGERGNDNEAQLKHGAALFLKEENRKKYPAIVVFPQCPAEDFWANLKVEDKTPREWSYDYAGAPKPALAAAMALSDLKGSKTYFVGASGPTARSNTPTGVTPARLSAGTPTSRKKSSKRFSIGPSPAR